MRGHGWRSAPFALLNPFYWVLHSIAAWRALVQLIRNPFYWEKTPHGLQQGSKSPSPAAELRPLPAQGLAAATAAGGADLTG